MKMMHITIQTQNFNEEIKFYQEIIGLSIQHEMNGMGRHIVFLGDNEGGMPIEIIDRPDAENSGNQFMVIDSCTQIMAVNQVRLLPNESGVFFVVSQ